MSFSPIQVPESFDWSFSCALSPLHTPSHVIFPTPCEEVEGQGWAVACEWQGQGFMEEHVRAAHRPSAASLPCSRASGSQELHWDVWGVGSVQVALSRPHGSQWGLEAVVYVPGTAALAPLRPG